MNNIIFIVGDVDDIVVCGAEGLFGVLSANLLARQAAGRKTGRWCTIFTAAANCNPYLCLVCL